MTPQFAKAVDPVFMHVLGLLDRIGRDESPTPQDERMHVRGWIDQAEAVLGQAPDWELAKHALVYWIDEVLINAPWEGRNWWSENPLEVELFNSRLANEQFYHKAREAGTLTRKDALEVFYVCAVLGFRGLYRDPMAAAMLAPARGLPNDLESWAKQTSLSIRVGARPPIQATGQLGPSAPPLEGQSLLVASSMATAVLGALTLIAGAWYFGWF
jgi:type VI secretion system protein ImpK